MIVIKYNVIYASTPVDIERLVNQLLELETGWQPLGPMGIDGKTQDPDLRYFQTMIRNVHGDQVEPETLTLVR